MTELTSAIQANYDVQFVIDAHAVVEYLVKYKTKPEKRSQTYKDMMKVLAKATDATTQTMAGMCASLINVLSGNRDFGDVETCHQLNQSELMWWSRVFSQPFQMDGRQALAKAPEERDEDDTSAPQATEQKKAFTKSKETWYVQRPEALEALSSYELLARFDDTGGKYMRLKFGPPKVPHYAPFKEQIHASVPQSGTVPPQGAEELKEGPRGLLRAKACDVQALSPTCRAVGRARHICCCDGGMAVRAWHRPRQGYGTARDPGSAPTSQAGGGVQPPVW